ncbi:hypothetical protein NX794_26920 [Streptomyces sp. LP11]|uniref:Uncharacterized protein n=1 Tax=Streptomyces pyxinicus TaxID=2970331 RepID=A0ABT2B8I7_9ACTN|nr:hypothetical protein [Streptomyces sp. LP11]MCS0604821.1 hypothetical protein [Streptomyces sp. LP11]
MAQEAHGARDSAKKPVTLYSRKKCRGTASRRAPGHAAPAGQKFASLTINPR